MTFQTGHAFSAEKPKSSKQTFDLYHVTITYTIAHRHHVTTKPSTEISTKIRNINPDMLVTLPPPPLKLLYNNNLHTQQSQCLQNTMYHTICHTGY